MSNVFVCAVCYCTPEMLGAVVLCLGATSVQYLSVEGLLSAVQGGIPSFQDEEDEEISSDSKTRRRFGHCTACLTGKYPVELEW